MPSPNIMIEHVPDLVLDKDDEDNKPYTGDDVLEKGDQVFIATISCKVEFIWAMWNILPGLAEAFHKNAKPKSFHKSVPIHLHNFEDLFSKSLFNHLPDHKVWDHVIKLIPGAKPTNCKVYPLTSNEQAKMDVFI